MWGDGVGASPVLACCWMGGELPDALASRSSSFGEESPLGFGMLSGVGSGERPSFYCLLFFFSCSSTLLLFLSRVRFASSFRTFCALACSRFAAWVLRTGGFEGYPLRDNPYKRSQKS